MCLKIIWTDEEMEEWLADKPEVIEVWKLVIEEKPQEAYAGMIEKHYIYADGFNQDSIQRKILAETMEKYWSGYHFFISEKDVDYFVSPTGQGWLEYTKIKCLVKKSDITAMGWSGYYAKSQKAMSLVVSQAIFPHYPETEARLEDLPQEEVQEEAKEKSRGIASVK